MTASISESTAWKALATHAGDMRNASLRKLLGNGTRGEDFRAEAAGVLLDYSRQLLDARTMQLLYALADAADLKAKLKAMAAGDHINRSEDRAVLHTALRAPKGHRLMVDGVDVNAQVHGVLARIKAFSQEVRSGKRKGVTGKPLTDVVSIGIGGSYLGPEFVAEALRTDPACARAAAGRRLRFLANVDPIDVARQLEGLDPARTLVVVVSKTFTTAETMLNARTVRDWLTKRLGAKAVAKHMVAVSTNLAEVERFGIDPANAFGFWDWVGGRYSVCSAVGILPLSLHCSFARMQEFLAGAHAMDEHFLSAPYARNLPVLLGLLGVWNSSFLGFPMRALLPYSQALLRLPAHIQQVDMESNGKRVALDGSELPFAAGEVDFGEPGTNGQHSFYQLIHQGRVVPADFIGFCASQSPARVRGEPVDNHDELMSNFFAQPDALAFGKTADELRAEGVKEALIPHKVFPGNRPSSVLLMARLDARACGTLLALYEHRTAVQGFVWGIDSFDQWGVELGKVLAKQVRTQLAGSRSKARVPISVDFTPPTQANLLRYLAGMRPAAAAAAGAGGARKKSR